MSIPNEIRAAIELANESFQSGYRQGVLDGKREMLTEIKALLKQHGIDCAGEAWNVEAVSSPPAHGDKP